MNQCNQCWFGIYSKQCLIGNSNQQVFLSRQSNNGMGPFILEIAEPRIPWESVALHWRALAVSGPKGAAIYQNYRYYMKWYDINKAVVQRSAPCSSDTWALHLSTSSSASKRGMALKQTVASNFHKSHQIALCLVTMPPSRWQRQRVDQVGAFVEIRQSSSIICTVYVQLLPWNKPVNIPILDYIRLSNAKYIYMQVWEVWNLHYEQAVQVSPAFAKRLPSCTPSGPEMPERKLCAWDILGLFQR